MRSDYIHRLSIIWLMDHSNAIIICIEGSTGAKGATGAQGPRGNVLRFRVE